MSAPFKDPRTGIYYFRKVIPPELRPAFGKREYKVSLGTRDPVAAKSLMPDHAAAYERLALNAKAFLRGGVTAQASHYVDRWLHDTERDRLWLWDAARALTVFTRLASERGLSAPAPDYVFEPEVRLGEDDALMLRTLHQRKHVPIQSCIEAVSRLEVVWLEWPTRQITEYHDLKDADGLFDAIALTLKRRIIEALLKRVKETAKPPQPWDTPLILIDGGLSASPFAPRQTTGSEVGLTITQAFEAWRDYTKGRARSPQLVQERSEESRVGKEGSRTCKSRWS